MYGINWAEPLKTVRISATVKVLLLGDVLSSHLTSEFRESLESLKEWFDLLESVAYKMSKWITRIIWNAQSLYFVFLRRFELKSHLKRSNQCLESLESLIWIFNVTKSWTASESPAKKKSLRSFSSLELPELNKTLLFEQFESKESLESRQFLEYFGTFALIKLHQIFIWILPGVT